MVGAFSDTSGGLLEFTGSIGDFLVALDKAIKEGEGFNKFFDGLGNILAIPVRLLGELRNAILGLFDGWDDTDSESIRQAFSDIGDKLGPLKGLVEGFGRALSRLGQTLGEVFGSLGENFSGLGDLLSNALSNVNFDTVLRAVQTGLLGGLFLVFKRFFGSFTELFTSGGGILDNIGEVFETLTGSLKAMQTSIQAGTLQKIAIAIGLLTASVVALSMIDAKKLTKALSAMTVAFGQLLASMAILVKISGAAGFVKIPIIAASMIMLAAAVDVLTIAVAALSRLSWEELAKGLSGVAALLATISTAAIPLGAAAPGLTRAGFGMIGIAVALRILAEAVEAFGNMNWSTIGKGLAAVAASLTAIGAATMLFPPGLASMGVGVLAISVALNQLAGAVKKFGDLDLSTIGKGLAAIAASLVLIGRAMTVMPPHLAAQGAGLALVSVGLRMISGALKSMGKMSIEAVAKSLIALGGSLAILAKGLQAMSGTFGGAAALTAASVGLALIAPSLRILGGMKWGSIVKGLVALGGALGTFGVAATALAPITPAVLGLSVALIALGAAMTLGGAGTALFASGLSALAVSGPAGIAILIKAIRDFLALVPEMAVKFTEGLVKMVAILGAKAPEFVVGLGKIFGALLTVIATNAPKMATAFTAVVQAALTAIRNNFPELVDTGLQMLLHLLQGIADNIGKVTEKVGDLVVNFLDALANKMPSIVDAGANLLVKFLDGIARNLPRLIQAGANVIVKFLQGVASQIGKVIKAAGDMVAKFLRSVADQIPKIISAGTRIIVKFIEGIGNASRKIVDAGVNAIKKFMSGISKAIPDLADSGFKAVIKLVRGIADAIRDNTDDLVDAAADLGAAIVEGIVKGLVSLPIRLAEKLINPLKSAFNDAKNFLGINSPSKLFMTLGVGIVDGMTKGVDDNAHTVNRSVTSMTKSTIDGITELVNTIPALVDGMMDTEPTITPVLDLSNVQKEATKLSDIGNVIPISAASSYGQASAISSDKRAIDQATMENADAAGARVLNFEQHNYSPEALSDVEIYRQTRNQLSQAKSVLDKVG